MLDLMDAHQFEANFLRRAMAWICLLLVLVFSGLEAGHAHFDFSRNSGTPCVICVSVHAQSPSVVVDALPVLVTAIIIAVPNEIQGNSLAGSLRLFIRPPPSSR